MMKVEFLYYDKRSCDRCRTSDKALKATMRGLQKAIKASSEKIVLKETKLPASRLSKSPTILINGKDIETLVNGKKKRTSNNCSDCCDLVGRSVSCRSFAYKGRKYDYIPKGMITDGIAIVVMGSKRSKFYFPPRK